MDNQMYLMRSLMFVPAHNRKLLDSSLRRDADVLLLDIEDSVPIIDKQTARDHIREFVDRSEAKGKVIFPRVNDRSKMVFEFIRIYSVSPASYHLLFLLTRILGCFNSMRIAIQRNIKRKFK